MDNWYDYPGALDNLDTNPYYIEKVTIDEESDRTVRHSFGHRHRKDCSWIRNRAFKKKLVRRFLSEKPSMNFSQTIGSTAKSAWYITLGFSDYTINPYTHVYLSPRGDVRVLHGYIPVCSRCRFIFQLSTRRSFKVLTKVTNRKMRYMRLDEDMPLRYSYYKKCVEVLW